jgi:probable HAF family extracellular repeat protein
MSARFHRIGCLHSSCAQANLTLSSGEKVMFKQSQPQRRSLVAIALGAISASAIAQVATFRSLGHLPGDSQDSRAWAISADGQVVVRFSGSRAFRWNALDGMTALSELSPEYATSSAIDVSSDGTVIVGTACVAGFDCDPFLWTAVSGYTFVGGMSEGFLPYSAWGVSADGSIVVGGATSPSNPHERAYRWTAETGAVAIHPSDSSTTFYDISADGTTAVGFISVPIGWTEELGIFWLGSLGGGGKAFCTSADGSVIAGDCANDQGNIEAFRWTAETGMVGLGDFAGGFFISSMYEMSADGEILVGYGTNASFGARGRDL